MKKALFISLALLAGLSIATAQVKLSFNPAEGAKYQYFMDTSQDIKQKIMGQEIPMTQIMKFVYDMTILEKGNNEIKTSFVYSEMVYDLSSMMMNMKYDSKNPGANPSQIDAVIAKVFGSLIGKPFNVTFASDGVVTSVTGLSEIVDAVVNSFGNDQQSMVIAQTLKQQFSDESMKSILEQSMKIYPSKAIKPGDSWNIVQTTEGMGMSMKTNSTYKLRSADKKTALADVTSTIAGMDGKISGTQAGTVEFDVATGLPKASDISQNIKGTISANGMDMDMEITSKVKIRMTETK